MQLHQLDKRIRKMLEYLKKMSVIRSVPISPIQISRRGQDDCSRNFTNGSCSSSSEEEWFDFRFSLSVHNQKELRLHCKCTRNADSLKHAG